jgi:hypothetical protein
MESAVKSFQKVKKQPEFKDNKAYKDVFLGLEVFFMLKDKKMEGALALIDGSTVYGQLLKCQISLNLKQPKIAIVSLVEFLENGQND